MTKDSSQLKVLIVGGGYCGLTTAVECRLRGMQVTVLEAHKDISKVGDTIDFATNAGRVFNKWKNGEIGKKLWATGGVTCHTIDMFNAQDVLLCSLPYERGIHVPDTFSARRGPMAQIIWDYAEELGVKVRCLTRVVDYVDTETEHGVITESGEKILADVVLASDGSRSKAREKLMGLKERKVNSGYAIFRSLFELTDEDRRNPMILEKTKNLTENWTAGWVGKDVHGYMFIFDNARYCSWLFTHLDDADIGESWQLPAKKSDVHFYLDQAKFPQVWTDFVNLTPDDKISDYKLVWRDPIKTWLSSTKHCAIIGDAAHCHLPTSSQGACQAVEDAAVMAICLDKAKGDVPLALQVFERIRFNRSHVIHQSSISTRDVYHKHEWTPELLEEYPESLSMAGFEWITDYDVQKEAEKHFDHLAQDVRNGRKGTIEELSLPAGGTFEAQVKVEELRVGVNSQQTVPPV
ncbi:hypothetical protein QQZ08_008584 [Neonectria magnoliae]|uniref:FAD dependent oxidoreductase domain-containing protein n=1 Tax=Neonectria magnoliae TaxID=2732573 RepID=A0ABR1HUC2_9HYPO